MPRAVRPCHTDRVPLRRPHLAAEDTGALRDALARFEAELGLTEDFPPEALDEAVAAARTVSTDPEAAGLADLRGIPFLTIDPEESRDLDQAVHLERTADGAVLHYAIADVAAFVTPGGALDDETRRRGLTLYAADRRLPLHPHVLGEDAASLLPEVDRRAFVWRFDLDEGARPLTCTLTRAVIRSREKWSYRAAQDAVDAGTAPPTIAALPWFGAARLDRERERGGASLDVAETDIVVDASGYRLRRRELLPVESWNAQVSLLTGMAAADIMLTGGVGILRTMPAPDAEDLAAFRAQTVALGIPWRFDQSYGEYLRTLGSTPAELAVRDAASQLFRGAGYVVFDGEVPAAPEQAAIGAPYTHTTAPIRRLVDRWSLVLCEALANGREVPAWARDSLGEMPKIMGRGDQLANRLENGSIDRIEAALLHGREGDVFDGIVLRSRAESARVQLSEPPVTVTVEGLLVDPGTRVRLRLRKVDIATGTIDLEPA